MIFYSHANKTHFHNKGFALSLVYKRRVSGTRKWPNNFRCLTFLPCNSVNGKHDHWQTNICLTPDTSGLWCRLYRNGWLLLHWRWEKSIKTKDTLTWVQESKSLVVSTVNFFPSIQNVHSHCKLALFQRNEKWRVNTSYYTLSDLMNSQRVIIVHLRRGNPTKNIFQLQAKVKLNCGRKVWDELCHYKTFLRVDWEGVFVNAESAAESRELYFL